MASGDSKLPCFFNSSMRASLSLISSLVGSSTDTGGVIPHCWLFADMVGDVGKMGVADRTKGGRRSLGNEQEGKSWWVGVGVILSFHNLYWSLAAWTVDRGNDQ